MNDSPLHYEDRSAWDGVRFGQRQDSARVYAFIARDVPIAAVLRRGPGRQTALLKWDLETDEVTLGQWVQSRIYERRCDLSPDGKHFLYFAGRHKGPLYSWTAISILPWFRACVLWQKGDCWGGGGLFAEKRTVHLNHRPEPQFGINEFAVFKGHLPRPWRHIEPMGSHAGWGEDEPIQRYRLERDGWQRTSQITKADYTFKGQYAWNVSGANVMEKLGPGDLILRMIDDQHGERNGRTYLTECQIVQGDAPPRSLGRVDWADWHGSHVLFARNGKLWRLAEPMKGSPKCVIDLNPMRYERIIAPYKGASDPT